MICVEHIHSYVADHDRVWNSYTHTKFTAYLWRSRDIYVYMYCTTFALFAVLP